MSGILNIIGVIVFWAFAIFGGALFGGLSLGPIGAVAGILAFLLWIVFVFVGAQKRQKKAIALVKTTLMPDEQIDAQGIQHRVFAFFHRRTVLTITNSRIMTVSRGLLGGFKMLDIQWKDLTDCRIEQNVLSGLCGSNLSFKHMNPGVAPIAVSGIQSAIASTIYSRAQHEEQAWEEKRRVRQIEETRAAAGGVFVTTATAPAPASQSTGTTGNRMLDEIKKAKELLDAGTVTDAEFQEMKAKILAGA
jgi:hypothetical protein